MAHLADLTQLQYLTLEGGDVTDAGMEHLKGLCRLQLPTCSPKITYVGLACLRGLTGS